MKAVHFLGTRSTRGGAWVAQLVKPPTSALVMISHLVGSSPTSGSVLIAQSPEPASDSVCVSLSGPPPLTLCLCLCLSQTQINIKKKDVHVEFTLICHDSVYERECESTFEFFDLFPIATWEITCFRETRVFPFLSWGPLSGLSGCGLCDCHSLQASKLPQVNSEWASELLNRENIFTFGNVIGFDVIISN